MQDLNLTAEQETKSRTLVRSTALGSKRALRRVAAAVEDEMEKIRAVLAPRRGPSCSER